MAVINLAEYGLAGEIRGKIGANSAYGYDGYGGFKYGAGAKFFGIWQVRTRFDKRVQVKMKYYWPTNPQTEAQQAWRAIFSAGVSAWQALSEEAKDVYRDLSKYFNLTGFNLYMAEYLNEHK